MSLSKRLDPAFSHIFQGIIWNTIADGGSRRLFLELRDPENRTVSFSALNLRNNQWLWKDVMFEEPWWISMRAVAGDILLLTVYADENNPDKKGLVACDAVSHEVRWWRNGFSVTSVSDTLVTGVDARFPEKEAALDLFTGQPAGQVDFHLVESQNFPVIRPFQYREGTANFETVKDFLESRWAISPVSCIEYLEYQSLILMSVFVQEEGLANYLYVLDTGGCLVKTEKLGEGLQGIGLDTFYIFLDRLFFVKNKRELTIFNII